MTIRQKVVALVALLFTVLIGVDVVIQERVLLPSFAALERIDAQTSMTRVRFALDKNLEALESTTSDWSDWGELYQFMATREAQFINTYTTPVAMAPLKVNVLLLIDGNGGIVFASSRDLESGSPLDIDFAALKVLPANFPWRANLGTAQSARGLLNTNRGVMMIVAAPILDGTGSGTSRGMTIMGRILTSKQLAAIGTQAQAALFMADLTSLPPGDISETASTTTVYRSFDDIYGQPLMALKIDVPRDITARGHTAVNYSSWYLLGAAITVLVLLLIVLDRLILRPIDRVTRHAVSVGERGDLTAHLDFKGSDEISLLAREFDRMVDSVSQSRRQLVDQSFQAGFAELAKGVMHNLGNAMTPLGVRLSVLSSRFANAPLADIEWAAAEFAAEAQDAERQAELVKFIQLGCREVAAMHLGARGDIAIIERQAAIISAAVAEQMASTDHGPVLEAVRLPELVGQSLDIVPDSCRECLVVDIDESLRSMGSITIARTVLRLILQNLIINAADAIQMAGMEKGILRISAEVSREETTELLHLQCRDNGVGIAAENLQRMFEKGFSTKSRETNHGIGLHWCANAIRALGGRIWAVSDGVGHGSSMHLVLPISSQRNELETLAMEAC